MPAFAGAVALGFTYVETDAHVTADGVVLAFHDDRLDRVTTMEGRINDLPWSEVSRALVDGAEPIPLLEEILESWPEIRVNIDAKSDEVVEPLAALLMRLNCLDRVCVGSFSDSRLERMRTLLGPGLCTSMGPRAVARVKATSYRLGNSVPPGDCLQVPVSSRGITLVDDRFIRRAKSIGIPVHVWTIDDEAEMSRLLDMGVDGIMTDRPSLLKSVLAGRGQWPAAF
ncbi:UgpQ Glycerophosphoryl diester phosphodiesterase [Acidimicrobiia bacterium]